MEMNRNLSISCIPHELVATARDFFRKYWVNLYLRYDFSIKCNMTKKFVLELLQLFCKRSVRSQWCGFCSIVRWRALSEKWKTVSFCEKSSIAEGRSLCWGSRLLILSNFRERQKKCNRNTYVIKANVFCKLSIWIEGTRVSRRKNADSSEPSETSWKLL